jgi:omega-6 fatty acid desaturase (delta-12 desaturase)
MILFAYVPIFLVSFCLWPFFENPRKYYDCGLAAMLHFSIGFGLYHIGGWSVLVYSMLTPSLMMFSVGGYVFYAQHNFPSVLLKSNDQWDYLDAALHSSSFIRMSSPMRWFTANIGYHHVHHVNSRIPFYRLQEAMSSIPELQNPRCTSLHPLEIWKCLRLKLWDEEQGRLIPLKEFRQ